jgi:hypothetical protein
MDGSKKRPKLQELCAIRLDLLLTIRTKRTFFVAFQLCFLSLTKNVLQARVRSLDVLTNSGTHFSKSLESTPMESVFPSGFRQLQRVLLKSFYQDIEQQMAA